MASLEHAAHSSAFSSRQSSFVRPAAARDPFAPEGRPRVRLDAHAAPAESLEITVLWGETVLGVQHLTPPRAFSVGEGQVDFAISAARLGRAQVPLIEVQSGVPFALYEPGQAPCAFQNGDEAEFMAESIDFSAVAPGMAGLELRQGRALVLELGGLRFRVEGHARSAPIARGLWGGLGRSELMTLGGSALLQAAFTCLLAYFSPALALADDESAERERFLLLQQYLNSQAERERLETPAPVEPGASGEPGAPAAGTPGESGKSGVATAAAVSRRMAILGDHAERISARAEELAAAREFGMIGLISSLDGTLAPSVSFGAEPALGADAATAWGDLWGDEIGDARGRGLGLTGTGEGAGRKGTSIGVGLVGIGTCSGLSCYGSEGGFARSRGLPPGTHAPAGPRVRLAGDTRVSGRLPPEVIQRTIRLSFGRFRLCYEQGLRSNPNLTGRVSARFVIDHDGAVSNVASGGSDLPDAAVVSCILSSFYGLSFPAPEGGVVSVVYPISLSPS